LTGYRVDETARESKLHRLAHFRWEKEKTDPASSSPPGKLKKKCANPAIYGYENGIFDLL